MRRARVKGTMVMIAYLYINGPHFSLAGRHCDPKRATAVNCLVLAFLLRAGSLVALVDLAVATKKDHLVLVRVLAVNMDTKPLIWQKIHQYI